MSKIGRMLTRSLISNKDIWVLYKKEPFLKRVIKVIYFMDILNPVFEFYYSVINFFDSCKRLIEYAPLIWNHRNWDYGFVLKFDKKLYEDLYKGCFVNGNATHSNKEKRRLKVVIALLDRIHKDEYLESHRNYFDRIYGPNNYYFRTVPGTASRPGGPYSTIHSTREDKFTPEQKEQYYKALRRLHKHENYQIKQDLELLGKYISRYSRKWWD